MTEISKYDTIFMRRSIRKYIMSGGDPDIPERILKEIENLEPLYQDIKVEFHLLDPEVTRGGIFGVKAPHYVAGYSQRKDEYLMNMGYMMQQLDLALSARGIGTCWIGTAKPTRDFASDQDMTFVVAMAAGTPAETAHRIMVSDFNRKPLEQITNIKGYSEDPALSSILEAARLSPSATNSQPWYFSGTGDAIRVFRQTLNPLKVMIYDKMNQIDIGIALCHIRTAAAHFGKTAEFIKESDMPDGVKGYDYCMTVRLT